VLFASPNELGNLNRIGRFEKVDATNEADILTPGEDAHDPDSLIEPDSLTFVSVEITFLDFISGVHVLYFFVLFCLFCLFGRLIFSAKSFFPFLWSDSSLDKFALVSREVRHSILDKFSHLPSGDLTRRNIDVHGVDFAAEW
jgi:hypothetical protein